MHISSCVVRRLIINRKIEIIIRKVYANPINSC